MLLGSTNEACLGRGYLFIWPMAMGEGLALETYLKKVIFLFFHLVKI